MKLALIGVTGRTGQHALTTALDHNHTVTVLARDPDRLPIPVRQRVRVVTGESTDPAALSQLLNGTDAVISALGPTNNQPDLHTRTAHALIQIMNATGPRRFIGVSGAGIHVPGDHKTSRDKFISRLIRTFGRTIAHDKANEYQAWAATDLDWTLLRAPRLTDQPGTGHLEHDPHHSTRSTQLSRADLGTFLIDTAEHNRYTQTAPFIATAKP